MVSYYKSFLRKDNKKYEEIDKNIIDLMVQEKIKIHSNFIHKRKLKIGSKEKYFCDICKEQISAHSKDGNIGGAIFMYKLNQLNVCDDCFSEIERIRKNIIFESLKCKPSEAKKNMEI